MRDLCRVIRDGYLPNLRILWLRNNTFTQLGLRMLAVAVAGRPHHLLDDTLQLVVREAMTRHSKRTNERTYFSSIRAKYHKMLSPGLRKIPVLGSTLRLTQLQLLDLSGNCAGDPLALSSFVDLIPAGGLPKLSQLNIHDVPCDGPRFRESLTVAQGQSTLRALNCIRPEI
jgi:hypothetical protein